MRSSARIILLVLLGFGTGWLASSYRALEVPVAEANSDVFTVAGSGDEVCVRCVLPDFVQLSEKWRASVVNIATENKAPKRRQGFRPGPQQGGPGREPFERFFGPQGPGRGMPRRSLGSGFIFDGAGYILTNNHVIENADAIHVKLTSGEEFDATLVGRDPKTDIAVLKIDAGRELQAIPFGDSENLKVGEWVMAIGNPFGLDFSVTAGIVSAKGRFIGQGNYDDFIQTDAPINPGNSGGPLISLDGRVVGINTSIFSRSGGNIGIGFAIPINLARQLIPQLQEKGKVTRGWMGVMIQKVTPDIAESLGMDKAGGALVADVVDGGPAELAGVQVGDVILTFAGKDVAESTDLPLLVAQQTIGETVEVVVIRNGAEKTLELKVAEMEDDELELAGSESEAFGLAAQNLTPEIAESLGLEPETEGVLVSAVEPGTSAADAGLRRGDVILEVNRKVVANLEEYSTRLKERKAGKSVLLLVRRGDNTVFLALKPPAD
ncbi:MAG: DegQ family serine endoprotease [Deltaproteobacteria bacterium]